MPREQPSAACVEHGSHGGHGASRGLGEVSCATGVPGRPSKPRNTQTVRCSSSSTVCSLTSLDSRVLAYCTVGKYSLVTCASAARDSPNSQSRLVHDSTVHSAHSVSNVHARVSESSTRVAIVGLLAYLISNTSTSTGINDRVTVQYDREREVDLAVYLQILL